jgi:hypothetical protein
MRVQSEVVSTVRPVQPDELELLTEESRPEWSKNLPDALFCEPVRAWCQVVEKSNEIRGYVIYTTLFSTWQARNIIDIQSFEIFDPVTDLGAALLGMVATHASELGARTVRWQQVSEADEHIAALFADAAALTKVRFELPISAGEVGVTIE